MSQASSGMYRKHNKIEKVKRHKSVSRILLVMRMQSDLKGLSRFMLTLFTRYKKESQIIARIGNPLPADSLGLV
jgi:hypothetical protein